MRWLVIFALMLMARDNSISKTIVSADSTTRADRKGNGTLPTAHLPSAPIDRKEPEGSSSQVTEASSLTRIASSAHATGNEGPTAQAVQLDESSKHGYKDPAGSLNAPIDKNYRGIWTTPSDRNRNGALPSTQLPAAPIDSADPTEPSSSEFGFTDEPSLEEYDDSSDTEDDSSSTVERAPVAAAVAEANPETPPTGNLTANLTGLSASEIKARLVQANVNLENANHTRSDSYDKWKAKFDEALKCTQDYEEKKKEWEKLDKIAGEKEEDWKQIQTSATTARTAYDTAKGARESLDAIIVLEQGKLDKFPQDIVDAKAKVTEVEGRPNKLAELEALKLRKNAGKAALEQTVIRLSTAVGTTEFEWNREHQEEVAKQGEFDANNCADAARAAANCPDILTQLTHAKEEAGKAKGNYDKALEDLKEPKKEFDNFEMDMWTLQQDIDNLVELAPNYDRHLEQATNRVAELEGKQTKQGEKVDALKTKQTEALAEEGRKETVKIEAEQKAAGNPPPETITARSEARNAKRKMKTANRTKTKLDNEVKNLKSKLDADTAAVNRAEGEVELLTTRYAEAKREEEDKPKDSKIGMYIGIGIVVLLALVVLIVVGVLFRKKIMEKFRGDKKPKNEVVSRAPSQTGRTGPSDPAAQPLLPKKYDNPNMKEGSKEQKEFDAAVKEAKEKAAKDALEFPRDAEGKPVIVTYESVNQYNEANGGLPDLSKTPFIPGEEPFKIPAKHFKWKGPMRRRTRWHGEPKHDFENDQGVSHIDKIWFDQNANFASEIGQSEIMEDGGPASDSNRSEWMNNLSEYERGHKAMLEKEAAEKAAGGPAKEPGEKAMAKDEDATGASGVGDCTAGPPVAPHAIPHASPKPLTGSKPVPQSRPKKSKSRREKDQSRREKNQSRREKNQSRREKNQSRREKNQSRREKNQSRREKDQDEPHPEKTAKAE